MPDTAHDLAVGSQGDAVKLVQKALNRGGWLAEDGMFGPATENAVKAFQASKGLVVDGIVGEHTSAALGS